MRTCAHASTWVYENALQRIWSPWREKAGFCCGTVDEPYGGALIGNFLAEPMDGSGSVLNGSPRSGFGLPFRATLNAGNAMSARSGVLGAVAVGTDVGRREIRDDSSRNPFSKRADRHVRALLTGMG